MDPDRKSELTTSLEQLLSDDDYVQALSTCDELLKVEPHDQYGLQSRAFILRQLRRFVDAEEAVNKGLQDLPDDPYLLNQRAIISYDQADWEKALAGFRDTLNADAKNERAWQLSIRCHRMLRDFSAAAAAADKALALLPNNSALLYERALVSYDQADWEKALAGFQETLKADAKNEKAWQLTVACHRLLRDFSAAAAAADKGLALLPNSPFLLNERAFISYDQGDWTKALAELQETLKTDAKNEKAWQLTVTCHRLLRDFSAAAAAADKALALLPNNPALLNERAFISYGRGDWKEALAGLQETLKADAKNEKAWQSVVVCHRLLRDFSAAAATVAKALTLLPNNPALLNERAFISYDQDDWTKALAGFQETLKADGKNEKAWQITVSCQRQLRDFPAAAVTVDKALALLPRNPVLLNERAFVSYDQGDWGKALAGFQETITASPKNEVAHANVITCYRKLGDSETAGRAMRESLEALPTSATVQYNCGLAYLEDRKLSEAEKAFGLAVALSPDWTEPVFKLADVLTRSGRQSEAFSRVQELKTKFPTDPRVKEALGFMHIQANDLTSARSEFNAILAGDPQNEIGKNGLAAVMFNAGRFLEAADIFEELAARNDRELVFRTNQARALSRMIKEEDLLKAKKICEEVISLDRVNAPAMECLGVIHYKLGRWNESEEWLRRAVSLSPIEGPYRDLGALYTKQGRYDEAEEQLKVALQINKFDTRAYIEMGSLYFEMDRKTDALRMLRRAVATDRNSAEAIQALGKGLVQMKELAEAEQQLRSGIKRLNPRDCFGLHLSLARVLIQVGSKANDAILLEEALQQATRAVKLEPENPDGYFELGMAHNALNSPRRALRSFSDCQDLAPDHLEAQRNIARLRKLLTMEKTARRSDLAGFAISIVSITLLLTLWGFYLSQPAPAPVAKVAGASVSELITKGVPKIAGKPVEVATAGKASGKAAEKAAGKADEKVVEKDDQPLQTAPGDLRIDKSMMLTFTPLLLFLLVIGAVLPWVGRLKFAGMEAELQQARVSIGTGPSGQTGSGAPDGVVSLTASGGNFIDTGPR